MLLVTYLDTFRIIATWYLFDQDSGYPGTNFDIWYPLDDTKNKYVRVQVQDDRYRQHFLSKNAGDAPLLMAWDSGTATLHTRPKLSKCVRGNAAQQSIGTSTTSTSVAR